MWLVGSDGTTPPTTQAAGQPQINWLARGTATVNTAATLSAVSVNAGEYYIELSASEVSALGVAAVHYRAAAVLPSSTYFQIANFDSGNSYDLGLAAWSGVSIHAGTHSDVTIQGLSRINSNVTLNANTHSGATIQGLSNYANISNVTLQPTEYSNVTVRIGLVNYSGATVGAGNIAAGSYSGVTVEVSNVAQSARSLIADDLLRRSIAAGAAGTSRSVQDALRSLRNRVDIGASVGTVYSEDDSTSAWTFSISTTANGVLLTGFNPAGGSA